IDAIKELGFRAATISGLSVSVTDCEMIPEKDEIIEKANKRVEAVQERYQDGLLTLEERKRLAFDVWIDTTEEVADKTWDSYDAANAVKVMINSGGTRASKDQVKQLAAMRGLVVDPLGNIVEMPTKSNFREGLSIFEYVTSARGSRKGLTDSAVKTADAGYLTRRLTDVAHDMIIRDEDCGTTQGIIITKDKRPDVFETRITGRVTNQDVVVGKKALVKAGEMISAETAAQIAHSKLDELTIRSPLTCELPKGMCAHCYGWDFSTRAMVEVGVPVGIVAAQSIGEPGTQLTMRVKHSGGIVGLDVTQGLPRVEELLEARTPKSVALISEVAGTARIEQADKETTLTISPAGSDDEVQYIVSNTTPLLVKNNQKVRLGQQLTAGSLNPKELLQIKGLTFTQQQTINDVQAVYESQGIQIHDKHFEVIVRKMSDKVLIESAGDTSFLTGEVVERSRFIEVNDETMAGGGEPATAKILFLGITRSSIFTNSWLSAASFQYTKAVLTDAAASGSVDYLEGLKENVIIGRLIPTSEERARL
ncbi:DNA-directed RNA polymerase subunit beta', partial [Candidatus Woesebacteria bacterium]|nr:DNA-directed RNA polymerase subunit beta' [Candidatus Woesebacteria bacterium]